MTFNYEKKFYLYNEAQFREFPELKSAKANTPIAKSIVLNTPRSINILRNVPLLKSSEVVHPSMRI